MTRLTQALERARLIQKPKAEDLLAELAQDKADETEPAVAPDVQEFSFVDARPASDPSWRPVRPPVMDPPQSEQPQPRGVAASVRCPACDKVESEPIDAA